MNFTLLFIAHLIFNAVLWLNCGTCIYIYIKFIVIIQSFGHLGVMKRTVLNNCRDG